jgi:type IV pilus assembly protein PilE
MPMPFATATDRGAGFTLVELIVVLAIVAVLGSIAVPQYLEYMRRGRLTEATTRLADHRVRMEQYYLDNRRYDDDTGNCGWPVAPVGGSDAFALACTANASFYTVTATGVAARGMLGFVYTIDQANARRTTGVPAGWVPNDACWVVRRDGTCG